MKQFLLSALLWMPAIALASQDSLLNIISAGKQDTQTVWTYNELLLDADKKDSAFVADWYKNGLAMATQLGFTRGELALMNSMGKYYKSVNRQEDAIHMHKEAAQRAAETGDKLAQGINNNNLGNLYNRQGKYVEALGHYMEALKIFENLKDKKRASSTMMSIGNVHADNKNPDKALEYYKRSMVIKQELGDEENVTNLLINMGSLEFDRKHYEEALGYFKEGRERSLKAHYDQGLYVSLNNISTIYRRQEKWKLALEFALESQQLRDAAADVEDMAFGNLNLGIIYMGLKDWKNAEKRFQLAISQAEVINALEVLEEANLGLADVLEQYGKFEEALQYRKKYETIRDTLTNRFSREQIAEMEAVYQTEKKDLEIQQQQLELDNLNISNSRKTIILVSLGIALVAVILLGWLFYNRYRLKQQRILDAELIQQQEIRNKAIIEAEEKERVRIAKDLHDGVGQQIAAVKLHMSALETNLPFNEDEKWKALLKLVDDTARELREVSHNMMPNALLRSGLATAVREFINKIASTDTLKVDLQIVGLNERLESTTETILYRVLQECVSNVIKHARASAITIQLIRHEEELSLSIEDNGVGFNTAKLKDQAGIGMKNMESRIQYLEGSLDVESAPGKGTLIMISVPLSKEIKG